MNNICKDITCERLNNCPYNNTDRKYCPSYITEKPESAWEIVRRLTIKYEYLFYAKIFKWMKEDIKKHSQWYDSLEATCLRLLLHETKDEQQAIKIMQEIEKELKYD